MNTFGQLKIKERCGMAGRCLVRRGIPFAKGELVSRETVTLIDADGNPVPCQNRVLQTFPNGDIRWLAVCFETRLQPKEEQSFSVRATAISEGNETPIATETENGYVLKNNASLCLEIEDNSVKSLSYQGN